MFRCPISRQCLRRTYAVRTASTHPRYMSASLVARFPRKDATDKDSIDTTTDEFSKSGGDDAAAGSNAAFDPSTTSPEASEKHAQSEGNGNSLNVSPGNPEVSKPKGAQEGGSQGSPKGRSGSGPGGARKDGGGKSG